MLMQANCGAPLHWLAAFGTDPVAIFAGGAGFSALTTFVDAGDFSTTTTLLAGFSLTLGAVTAATGASAGGSDAQALRQRAPIVISPHRKFMIRIPRQHCRPEWQSPRTAPGSIMTAPGGGATPIARFFFRRGEDVTRANGRSVYLTPTVAQTSHKGEPGTARLKAVLQRLWPRSPWTRPADGRAEKHHRYGFDRLMALAKTPRFQRSGMPTQTRSPAIPHWRLTAKRARCERVAKARSGSGNGG